MTDTSKRWRAIVALATVAGAVGLLGAVVTPAQGEGVSRANLLAHDWICVEFLPANRWSCFNPGLGRPFPGNPDPRPTYTFVAFDRSSGEFIYTGHLIRGDLYSGQPCALGGDPYVPRPFIGYYECVHL
jgi:hypothetical protein